MCSFWCDSVALSLTALSDELRNWSVRRRSGENPHRLLSLSLYCACLRFSQTTLPRVYGGVFFLLLSSLERHSGIFVAGGMFSRHAEETFWSKLSSDYLRQVGPKWCAFFSNSFQSTSVRSLTTCASCLVTLHMSNLLQSHDSVLVSCNRFGLEFYDVKVYI